MTTESEKKGALGAFLAAQPPSLVAAALARRTPTPADRDVPQPEPGQCWLLRWEDTRVLAVLTRVHDDHLLAMPMQVNPNAADETALVVPAGQDGFGHDVAVFAMLETGIGPWVLDCYVTTLGPLAVADSLRQWMRTGDTSALPTGWRQGLPAGHEAHSRTIARHELAERIALLGEADWVPQAWSREERSPGDEPSTRTSLEAPAVDVQAMLRALDGPPQRVLGIARGLVEPTAADLDRLAAAGIVIGAVRQPPAAVIRDLDSPAQKAAVTELATRRGLTESQTRQDLARENLALAARTATGHNADLPPSVRMLREAMRRELETQPE